MYKHKEKYSWLWLLTFLGLFLHGSIMAQIPDQPTNYVTDAAGLLSDEEESSLNATLKTFEDSTTHQIFVLLTQSLEGRNIEELTIETATRWGVGQKGQDNGLLIAIYAKDRQMRFEVGYGLEANLTDYETQRIQQDYMIPFLKNGDYFGAVQAGVIHAMEEINSAPQAEETEHIPQYYYNSNPYWPLVSHRDGIWYIHIFLIIGLGFAGILLFHYLIGKIIQGLGEKMKNPWIRGGILWGGNGLYMLLAFLSIGDKTDFYLYPEGGETNLGLLLLLWGFPWMNTLSSWLDIASEVHFDFAKQRKKKKWKQQPQRKKKKYQDYGFWIKIYFYVANLFRTVIIWLQFVFLSTLITNGLEDIDALIAIIIGDAVLSGFSYFFYAALTGKVGSGDGSTSSTYSSSSWGSSSSSSSYSSFDSGSSFGGGGGGSFGGGGSSSSW